MVVLPSGPYLMGSPESERERMNREAPPAGRMSYVVDDETPQRAVTINAMAVGRYEVTVAQYAAFARDTNHPASANCISDQDGDRLWEFSGPGTWLTPGFQQTPEDPVVCVSWEDAQQYVAWLSQRTGSHYRLLTEAEWEYAARGGSTAPYPWGEFYDDACRYANVADATAHERYRERRLHSGFVFSCNDGVMYTAPVGAFAANGFGLYDMIGNVGEWLEDCSDAEPQRAAASGACAFRRMRGGGWGTTNPQMMRSAYRGNWQPTAPWDALGIRVAKDLSR
jgi:formylglycine-generating enzyme required for sulfatase activity